MGIICGFVFEGLWKFHITNQASVDLFQYTYFILCRGSYKKQLAIPYSILVVGVCKLVLPVIYLIVISLLCRKLPVGCHSVRIVVNVITFTINHHQILAHRASNFYDTFMYCIAFLGCNGALALWLSAPVTLKASVHSGFILCCIVK